MRSWTIEEFTQAVRTSESRAEVMRKLNIAIPGSYTTVNRWIKKLQLDTSHFLTRSALIKRLQPHKKCKPAIPIKELLIKDCPYDYKYVKKRVLREDLIPTDKCGICKSPPLHNGMPLVLQLDHINGEKTDQRLENLRLICPNCHSQTDTYCGRNTVRARKNKLLPPTTCQDCGKKISKSSTRCRDCSIILNASTMTNTIALFWAKVNKNTPNGCWEWQGGVHKNYGVVRSGKKTTSAHRFSYILAFGEMVDSTMCVCHKCENTKCVNPSHLFLISRSEKAKSTYPSVRHKLVSQPVFGESNGAAKLTTQQVIKIREMYETGAHSYTKLGKMFDVSKYTIRNILKRDIWKHV